MTELPFSIPNGSSRGRLVSLHTGKGIYCSFPWESVICDTISRWHIQQTMRQLEKRWTKTLGGSSAYMLPSIPVGADRTSQQSSPKRASITLAGSVS